MNGEKTLMPQKDDHEFDSTWHRPAAGHYSVGQSGQSSDPYGMSYYTAANTAMFPYSDALPSSQPWSNGQEAMTFLGGYTPEHSAQQHQGHYAMEAMFGSQNTYGFGAGMGSPFNAFFPSNSEPFWGSNSKAGSRLPAYHQQQQDYNYSQQQHDSYGLNDQSLKHVETGLSGLTLDHIKTSDQFSASSKPMSGFDGKKFGDGSGAVGQVTTKKTTWASIASQPAKAQPKSLKSKMSSSVLTGQTSKHLPSMEAIGTWEAKNGAQAKTPPVMPAPPAAPPQQQQSVRAAPVPAAQQWTARAPAPAVARAAVSSEPPAAAAVVGPAHPVLEKLRVENNYNPKEFDLNPKSARFFIIKSYSEDDIHRSIKYSIWCSTEHGNKRLDTAFKQQEHKGPIFLLYSVNGSGHFCGMAQMMSSVDYASSSSVWAQDKWKGQFRVKWVYVKDVPNAQLRHIRLENNENKPVTNSRDTQEVPPEKGRQVIKIMHHYRHTTSIFDDFLHYEQRQQEEGQRRVDPPGPPQHAPPPPQPEKKRQQWPQKTN